MNPQPGQGLTGLIPYAVIALVLVIRLRRVGKTRPLRLWALWLLPVLYAVFAIGLLVTLPPHGVGWLWCALALAAGSAIGWQRGRMMRIVVDPATGTLQQSQSLAGVLFLVALVAARSLLRQETMTDAAHRHRAGHRRAGVVRAGRDRGAAAGNGDQGTAVVAGGITRRRESPSPLAKAGACDILPLNRAVKDPRPGEQRR
ncbi:MAG: hypothetical protein NVSMB69_16100 [Novosphingobium sp.]